jgi:hypothetical protein
MPWSRLLQCCNTNYQIIEVEQICSSSTHKTTLEHKSRHEHIQPMSRVVWYLYENVNESKAKGSREKKIKLKFVKGLEKIEPTRTRFVSNSKHMERQRAS